MFLSCGLKFAKAVGEDGQIVSGTGLELVHVLSVCYFFKTSPALFLLSGWGSNANYAFKNGFLKLFPSEKDKQHSLWEVKFMGNRAVYWEGTSSEVEK